jgi:hypothetical protein
MQKRALRETRSPSTSADSLICTLISLFAQLNIQHFISRLQESGVVSSAVE